MECHRNIFKTVMHTYIIHHQSCNGSADLIIGLGLSLGAQENKQESVQ